MTEPSNIPHFFQLPNFVETTLVRQEPSIPQIFQLQNFVETVKRTIPDPSMRPLFAPFGEILPAEKGVSSMLWMGLSKSILVAQAWA